MFFFFFAPINSGVIAKLTLNCQYNIPSWTLIQYCKNTIDNALKLTSIINMCKLIISGKTPNDFGVETYSKELYPIFDNDELHERNLVKKYIDRKHDLEKKLVLLEKIDSQEDFWRLIKNQKRPNVLVRENNGWFPIYQSEDKTAIQLRVIKVESPPKITLEGLGSVINDLRFGKQREIQTQISWANQQIAQSNLNIEQMLNSTIILNDPRVPDGFKEYAKILYNTLFEKQKELNDAIGIKTTHIDIKG